MRFSTSRRELLPETKRNNFFQSRGARSKNRTGGQARELGEGYRLEPEPISEGGVQFIAWPGKVGDKPYKSVRFCGLRNWPLLTSDFCDDTTIHLESSQGSLGFFLKAFYDAPPFTVRELTAVTAAIASCFTGSSVEKMPSADRLARAYRRALQETPSLCSA